MATQPAAAQDDDRHEGDPEFPAGLPLAELVAQGKEFLERSRAAMLAANERGAAGRAACTKFSRAHDVLLKAIHKHLLAKREAEGRPQPGSHALIALGGYGRRELSLRSDVDIMFLIGDRKGHQEEFVKEFLHVLYDLHLDLGSAVRRTDDCLQLAGHDLQSTTAMIEARLVCGSRPLFQFFHENFARTVRGRGRRWFLETKLKEWERRRGKREETVLLLEPNLKESPGGLRDIHSLRWLLFIVTGSPELGGLTEAGVLTAKETEKLKEAGDFVLALRNELHALAPRRNDLLNFDCQVEIARRMGYPPSPGVLAEEAMMREYYGSARTINKLASRAFDALLRSEKGTLGSILGTLKSKRIDARLTSIDGELRFDAKQEAWLREDPSRIMGLFARARRMDLRVAGETLDLVERIAPALDDDFRWSEAASRSFMEILRGPKGAARQLSAMHDCGVLCAYLPEFENVRCMVRMDYYHRYTVDEHLIKAVEMLEGLLNEPENARTHAGRIAATLKKPETLAFALLMHDAGKGMGGGHALIGGQLVQKAGQRMGLDPEEVEMARFLVLAHLKISHVSQRRDLEDPKVGRDLAEEIGSMEKLDMLYVHSVCDLKAVSPDAWTDYKAALFEACHRSAARALEGAPEEPPAAMDEKALRAAGDALRRALEARPDGTVPSDPEEREMFHKRLEGFVESAPERYLQSMTPETVLKHFLMTLRLDDEKERIAWEMEPGMGVSELAVVSKDLPGVFAKTCGALAAKQINIRSALIFSTRDGYAINLFKVVDAQGKPLPEGFRIERLRADLNQVLLERKTMEELFEKHAPSGAVPAAKSSRSPRPTEIRVDNEGSGRFSILEVRTADRLGLLYRIASILREHGLNIDRAIVATEAYVVTDVFYLTDLEFNKIDDEGRIRRLVADLKRALDGEPEAPSDGAAAA